MTSAAAEEIIFPRSVITLLHNSNFDKQEISLINVSCPEFFGHSFNSTHCSIPFGNYSGVSNGWKAFQRCLTLNSMQKYTSRARLCPLLKHGSVMAFRPNTLIPFMALLSVNKCENCHCLFFPRSGQKTELRWRVGRYLGQDQLYFLSLFSHKLHKTPQHWAAVVPIHLH